MSKVHRLPRVLAVAAVSLLWLTSTASASPETLQRAVANVLCAPFDVALSPVIATYTVVDNVRNIGDSEGVRLAYALPGVAWNTGLVIGIGVIREITGLLEILPGLGLFFSESDIDPLLAPVENSEALIDIETPILWIRIGMLYTA
ncbi:MAG: hypothetical protein HRU01_17295 [Myxococcales bacterium]|nr:hypothetical protein [Myxococcales bacterium]